MTPEGETAYSVPVVKMQSFSLEQIFEKKLFFLLPFYIFNREKELPECDRDAARLEKLS